MGLAEGVDGGLWNEERFCKDALLESQSPLSKASSSISETKSEIFPFINQQELLNKCHI